MTNNKSKEEIKLEELKFIKQQEHFIQEKINIISVIVGIILTAAFAFFFQKYDSMDLNKKIIFFIYAFI